ncbi:MAG: SDR family oxidoreductase [Flavobacterium sp.]
MKTNKAQVSILGCGWLGFPLAKNLLSEGYTVKGSTTSESKIPVLSDAGINPYIVALSGFEGFFYDADANINITAFLQDSTILIVDIPPKLRGNTSDNFVKKIESLIPFIEKSEIRKVLFISSTSVYADDNSMVDENTIPRPDTEGGRQLLEAEKILQHNINFNTTVLRFGGLIGYDRHPIKFISGRENIENPDGSINLIHQNDCIGIIKSIIEQDCWNETFNAVSPEHPTREKYYTQKATELDLPLPKFAHEKPSKGKVISSYKIENALQYQFKTIL